MGAGSRNTSIVGGGAGIVGWIIFLVAFILAPTPPTLEASASDITKYLSDHHSATLSSAFLFATTALPFAL